MAIDASTTERRRGRIVVEKGALAFNGRYIGPIVEVSAEGLCFQYLADKSRAEVRKFQNAMGADTLDIIYGAYDFALTGLPVQTIVDFQISSRETDRSTVMTRRREVIFGQLTPEQSFSLKRFLLLNRYGAVPPEKTGRKKRIAATGLE